MATAKKKVSKKKPTEASESTKLADLEARIEKLEQNQRTIIDGYEFAANELRPIYGFGAVAAVFDAIRRKLA